MWSVSSLEDVFLRLFLHTCDDSPFNHICISYDVVFILKGALKTTYPLQRAACWEPGERAWERSKKYRRSKTQAANSFHTTAGGNWTEVNICQSSIYLNSVTSKGSLVRQLVFVEICGALMVQKLTYVLAVADDRRAGGKEDKKRERRRCLVFNIWKSYDFEIRKFSFFQRWTEATLSDQTEWNVQFLTAVSFFMK